MYDFSGEEITRTRFNEKKLMLRRQSRARRQKVIETDAVIRVRRGERLVTAGLCLQRGVVNESRDRLVWWWGKQHRHIGGLSLAVLLLHSYLTGYKYSKSSAEVPKSSRLAAPLGLVPIYLDERRQTVASAPLCWLNVHPRRLCSRFEDRATRAASETCHLCSLPGRGPSVYSGSQQTLDSLCPSPLFIPNYNKETHDVMNILTREVETKHLVFSTQIPPAPGPSPLAAQRPPPRTHPDQSNRIYMTWLNDCHRPTGIDPTTVLLAHANSRPRWST